MSATVKPTVATKNFDDVAIASQGLSVEHRGSTFEALFYRQLQRITVRVHAAETLQQVMLEESQDICKLFNADRLTLYVVNADQTAIISKVKTGLGHSRDLILPITPQSIAGYSAFSKQLLNIADVYDAGALKKIHPSLTFLGEVDRRTGYRTCQMLVAPILDGNALYGVLQIINNRSNEPFGELEVEGFSQLCKTLAIAIQHGMRKTEDALRRTSTKYDGLIADGVMTAEELAQCVQDARHSGQPIEQLLISQYKVQAQQIGPSLAKFFGVPYECVNPDRIRSELLHGALKRKFLEQQGWIPLEECPQGLVIMCIDPEAVCNTRIVPQLFPRIARFVYRVTTQTEFAETLGQVFGDEFEQGSVGELLADMDLGAADDSDGDESHELVAVDNKLVKFVNKIIAHAFHQRASDIHIEPMPGKQKTGIRLRIDGTLQPYIEVPAHLRRALVTRLKIMCDLDISEHRKPQDGKIKFKKYGPLDIELRVATIPSAGGVEDVVLRILSGGDPIPLERLGLTAPNMERLVRTIEKPHVPGWSSEWPAVGYDHVGRGAARTRRGLPHPHLRQPGAGQI